MNESVDIEIVRTEALRKLGRNIVNFSKIEGCLKFLLLISQIRLSVASNHKNLLHEDQKKINKKTLGCLARDLYERFIIEDESQFDRILEKVSDPETLIILSGITYENQTDLETQKQCLKDIIIERNELIHQRLATLDTTSVESYRELIILLDEQHPRLRSQHDHLVQLVDMMQECFKDLDGIVQLVDFNDVDKK